MQNEKRVREPAVAGQFYPEGREELQRQVAEFLKSAAAPKAGEIPKCIVVPHAGYAYSGKIAGQGFRAAENAKPKNIVIAGPSHYVEFEGSALSGADAWKTPLGEINVNKKYFEESETALVEFDEAHQQEHSVEVQVPFIQAVFPKAKIVPVVTGEVEPEQLAEDIDSGLGKSDLLVVSTDLSHYYPYEEARKIDAVANSAIPKLEIETVEEKVEACGKTGVLALMHLAKKRAWKGKLLAYANSGDTAGDKRRVVGYGAYGFY